MFIHGCLGGVGRVAAQLAQVHGATVAGSCRAGTAAEATQIGVDPVVEFYFDSTPLAGRFDLILDTAGALPITTARTMLEPGGRIVDLVPSPRKVLRSVLPGPYALFVGRPRAADLEQVAAAAARGDLDVPIASRVPLEEAIPALTALETGRTSRRGKLIVQVN